MGIKTNALWVVAMRHTASPYDFDTEQPDEVYITQEAAQEACDELNVLCKKFPKGLKGTDAPWYVTTLRERLETVKEAVWDAARYSDGE